MSELSERVAREHWISRNNGWHCVGCGFRDLDPNEDYGTAARRHLAEATEAAVRETIAASISRMGVAIRYPDCEIPLEPSTVRDIATRIARGES